MHTNSEIYKTVSEKNIELEAIKQYSSLLNDLKNLEYGRITAREKQNNWMRSNI